MRAKRSGSPGYHLPQLWNYPLFPIKSIPASAHPFVHPNIRLMSVSYNPLLRGEQLIQPPTLFCELNKQKVGTERIKNIYRGFVLYAICFRSSSNQ